jgi:hypothetical protein
VQSNFSELQLSNGENQGASGTGLGSLISPMLKVLDEMYRAQDELARYVHQIPLACSRIVHEMIALYGFLQGHPSA